MKKIILLIVLASLAGCTVKPKKTVFSVDTGSVTELQCSGSFESDTVCMLSTDKGYRFSIDKGVQIKLGTRLYVGRYNDGKCWLYNEGSSYYCGYSSTYDE